MTYPKRKPDKETELLRMWNVRDSEKEKFVKGEKEGFTIEYKGIKITLGASMNIKNKEGKVLAILNIKDKDKAILYFIVDDIEEIEKKKILDGLILINKKFQLISGAEYELIDLRTRLDSAVEEIKLDKKFNENDKTN